MVNTNWERAVSCKQLHQVLIILFGVNVVVVDTEEKLRTVDFCFIVSDVYESEGKEESKEPVAVFKRSLYGDSFIS